MALENKNIILPKDSKLLKNIWFDFLKNSIIKITVEATM
jgi:hypothetical protein